MRKIYIVPNFVTTANMFCGFFSMISAIHGEYVTAAWLILAAAVFDMLDGRIARLAKATSQFGVQYDSLSDLVSFGVAPGILLYQMALQPYRRLGLLAAFLFTACGALRLARFNVMSGVLPKGFFQGLPIPMAAGVVSTFIIFQNDIGWSAPPPVLVALTLVLASLMVSTIPFPSFKEVNWKARSSFGILMVGILVMVLLAVRPEVTIFGALALYILSTLGWNAMRVARGKPLHKPAVGVRASH